MNSNEQMKGASYQQSHKHRADDAHHDAGKLMMKRPVPVALFIKFTMAYDIPECEKDN